MTLSGPLITTFQRCPRRWRLEQAWTTARLNPGQLFRRLWEEGILAISQGAKVEDVAQEATTRFLEAAARPGLDTLSDPYTLSSDYCAALETSLEAISRLEWSELYGPITTKDWRSSSWKFMKGPGATILERWVAVEQWTPSTQAREVHSWAVLGDMAHSGLPMNLHIIELGSVRKGHIHGVWTRALRHPAIAHRYKFQHTDGRKLGSGWKAAWYADCDMEPSAWVDMMERDRVLAIHHLSLQALGEGQRDSTLRQIEDVTSRMEEEKAYDWPAFVMSRGACDWPTVCPWQGVCYQPYPQVVKVEDIGGYRRLPPTGPPA